MKSILSVATIVSIMFIGISYAGEKKNVDPAIIKSFNAALDRFSKDYSEERIIMRRLKKAGASYIYELTVTPKKADNIVDAEQQNLMAGVYFMDMIYAYAFDKKKKGLMCAEAINKLLDKSGYNNKKLFKQYQKTMKNINSPEAKKELKKLSSMLLDDAYGDTLKTHAGFEHTIDALYGWMIENLYISTEITAQSNYDPKIIKIVNEKKAILDYLNNIFDAIKSSRELEDLTKKDERMVVVEKIKKLLSVKKVGKKEIDEVRKIVTEERNKILK